MNWCNCDNDNDYDYILDMTFEYNGTAKCPKCGRPIAQEDIIILLLKNIMRLNKIVQDLEYEKKDKEMIKLEQEVRAREEEIAFQENENKQVERFDMMDL